MLRLVSVFRVDRFRGSHAQSLPPPLASQSQRRAAAKPDKLGRGFRDFQRAESDFARIAGGERRHRERFESDTTAAWSGAFARSSRKRR